ncbi:MAG: hypothetical protein M1401_08810 [Chloroflexi bacterium]|nr:hypothetical protein [Chloroflexota bacterium]
MKTAFKVFSDPEAAKVALEGLQAGGFAGEAVGVLVRRGGSAGVAAARTPVGTLPDVGPVVAASPEVFGLAGASGEADASEAVAAALGLSPEAVATFGVSLLRDSVLVAVRGEDEAVATARKIMRSADPANERIAKKRNDGFELAERYTSTNPNDGQFSGDFRKY